MYCVQFVASKLDWFGRVVVLALPPSRHYSIERTWLTIMRQKDNSTRLKFQGRFAWYELMTTDVEAAQAFYGEVLGWRAQDASTPELHYTLFSTGAAKLRGLM